MIPSIGENCTSTRLFEKEKEKSTLIYYFFLFACLLKSSFSQAILSDSFKFLIVTHNNLSELYLRIKFYCKSLRNLKLFFLQTLYPEKQPPLKMGDVFCIWTPLSAAIYQKFFNPFPFVVGNW